MSRPTRPQTRRPGGRTRPPGPIESAVLQARTTRVSSVRHLVEPPPGAVTEPDPPVRDQNADRVRALFAGGRGRGARWARSVRGASARQWAGGSRAVRRLRVGHWFGVIAALLMLGLAGYLVFFSAVLDVRQVRLVGGDRFTQAQLDEIAATELGRPLARADGDAIIGQVTGFPAVRDAQVVRAWPHTLEVRVDERVPVASVPAGDAAADGEAGAGQDTGDDQSAADDGYDLVAGDGVHIERVDEAPADLPRIDAEAREAGPPTVTAVATVLAVLDLDQRGRIVEATAASPDSIQLRVEVPVRPDTDASDRAAEAEAVEGLTREVTVQWGSAEESALKAEVLSALLMTRAIEYDVSAPRTPVTR